MRVEHLEVRGSNTSHTSHTSYTLKVKSNGSIKNSLVALQLLEILEKASYIIFRHRHTRQFFGSNEKKVYLLNYSNCLIFVADVQLSSSRKEHNSTKTQEITESLCEVHYFLSFFVSRRLSTKNRYSFPRMNDIVSENIPSTLSTR